MKTLKIAIFLIALSNCIVAQMIAVKKDKQTDKNGYNIKLALHFYDTTKKKLVDSLDLIELNPYNYLPYTKVSVNEQFNTVYRINNFADFDHLFPKVYRDKYFQNCNVDSSRYLGLLFSNINLSTFNLSNSFIAISFDLIARQENSDLLDGAISTILVFDNKKNLIYKKENCKSVKNLAVSDDGVYMAYCYGAGGPDNTLIINGIEIIETKTNRIVFKELGNFSGPSGGCYPDLIQFECTYSGGFIRDYYFNTRTKTIYSYYYNSHTTRAALIDIKPEGLVYKDKNDKQSILYFKKDFDVIKIK